MHKIGFVLHKKLINSYEFFRTPFKGGKFRKEILSIDYLVLHISYLIFHIVSPDREASELTSRENSEGRKGAPL